MKALLPDASERRICRLLGVSRSALGAKPSDAAAGRAARPLDATLVDRVGRLIERFPTYGYRRLWAWLRFREGMRVNRKAVYRVLQRKRWLVHQRTRTPRPRVRASRSQTTRSNLRWAMDVTHIDCGRDGWGHLTAVIDCHDRQIVGYEFALRGRAREVSRDVIFWS